jgi:hypothetical protein
MRPTCFTIPQADACPAESTTKSPKSNGDLDIGTVSQQPSDTVPAGSVIRQSPNSGTLVSQGSTVDLVVSSGSANGTVSVRIDPEEVRAVARWSVDGGAIWNDSDQVLSLQAGKRRVTFLAVEGWTAPSNQSVVITGGTPSEIVVELRIPTIPRI